MMANPRVPNLMRRRTMLDLELWVMPLDPSSSL
jgi:hypothetical protein